MDTLNLSAGILVAMTVIYWFNRRSRSRGLPIPGPKPHPFVGHTFQIPKIKTWKFFEKLAQEHGALCFTPRASH
jgi:hypothetical protein